MSSIHRSYGKHEGASRRQRSFSGVGKRLSGAALGKVMKTGQGFEGLVRFGCGGGSRECIQGVNRGGIA